MNPLAAIAAFFTAVGEALGLVKQRDAEKNAAPMVAAKKAQDAQSERDANAVIDREATQTDDKTSHDAALADARRGDSL